MSRLDAGPRGLGDRTIAEFGREWSQRRSGDDYYDSADLLRPAYAAPTPDG